MPKHTTITGFASVFAEHTNARDGRVHGAWRRELFSLEIPSFAASEICSQKVFVEVGQSTSEFIQIDGAWFEALGIDADKFTRDWGTDAERAALHRLRNSPLYEEERGKIYLQSSIRNEVAAKVDPRCISQAHERLQNIASRRFLTIDGQIYFSGGRLGFHVAQRAGAYNVRLGRWIPDRPDLRLRRRDHGCLTTVEGMVNYHGEAGTFFDLARFQDAAAYAAQLNQAKGARRAQAALPIRVRAEALITHAVDEHQAVAEDLVREITGVMSQIELRILDDSTVDSWIGLLEAHEAGSPADAINAAGKFSTRLLAAALVIPGVSEVAERVKKRVKVVDERLELDRDLVRTAEFRP